ncbi:threonine dehydrogenase-like Zn-dependent dehydrogenase [Streptomyces sp. SFB5A]|uniref:Threonine dehydrogenase-like Zn-dependent dehydrogenase n=1 Tax=Streptomyces nymphaeiformis TaxID=2663842 RepID=A0A7W7XAE4_9ACTN|nr:threonine dehydrogenase-like Zn-dependent dehydrogenase [Streptomyces nymphaeiformis]
MGVVAEVGPDVRELKVGDRVVVPFNVSCGACFMCERGLHSQCETTQVHEHGSGASLFGYTKLYGQVPGEQAEYLRVPFADTLPIRVPDGPPDERFVYLSEEGYVIDPEDLAHISPYPTEHVRRFGEYSTHELDLVPEAYDPHPDVGFSPLRGDVPRTPGGYGQAA